MSKAVFDSAGSSSSPLAMLATACTGEVEPTTTVGVVTTRAPETTTTAAPTTTVAGACRDTFCVRYNIRQEAAWADGTPVTAMDFVFTYETIADPALDIISREGYHLITGYEVVDDKTVVFAFDEIYAPWQTLFSSILPAHILEGEPFNAVWDDAITMGSGPFTFVEWVPEERITLARNPNYWGEASGDVQTLNILFIGDEEVQVDSLGDGEVDMIYPQPYVSLMDEVAGIGEVESVTGVGPVWEYFGFNQDDPRLQNLFVRQAITQGINREAIMDAVVRPITPGGQLLGNSVWVNSSDHYVDHFNGLFPYDPVGAEALLSGNGCVRGEDGIYGCGDQRLSFSWATTSGNEARDLHFELAQADLAAIGIEITPSFGPTSELLQTTNLQGGADVWQVSNLAWVASPDPAWGNTPLLLPGQRFERVRRSELLPLLRRGGRRADQTDRHDRRPRRAGRDLQPGRRAMASGSPDGPDVPETDAPRLELNHPGPGRQPVRDRAVLEHRGLEREGRGELRGQHATGVDEHHRAGRQRDRELLHRQCHPRGRLHHHSGVRICPPARRKRGADSPRGLRGLKLARARLRP